MRRFIRVRVRVRDAAWLTLLLCSAAHRVDAQQERASMLRYCDHVDSAAAPTLTGARERTDCWKQVQLQGLGNALVEERYRAAVRGYDNLLAADAARRAMQLREAQVDAHLHSVQVAIASGDLRVADSLTRVVLAVQSQNQRAIAFHDRIVALRRADQLRLTVYIVAGLVLLIGIALAVTARIVAVQQARAAEVARLKAAQRTAMVRIMRQDVHDQRTDLPDRVSRIRSTGRAERAVLSDRDAYVSRYHCAILRKEGTYYLIDSSLNGTYVDDELLERGEPRLLEDGSEFTLSGVTRLKFLLV